MYISNFIEKRINVDDEIFKFVELKNCESYRGTLLDIQH